MNIFKKIFASLRFREAIEKAENAYRTTGNRHYVIPAPSKKKLLVVDRSNFRTLKRKHYINQKRTCDELLRDCFYCTPDRGGRQIADTFLKIKENQFYDWFSSK